MIVWVLLGIGAVLCIIGGIWLLVVAFQESIGWGLACLIIPFVSLIFVIMYWDKAKKPFLLNLVGAVLLVASQAMAS